MNRDTSNELPMGEDAEPDPASSPILNRPMKHIVRTAVLVLGLLTALGTLDACHMPGKSLASRYKNVEPFNFDIALGPKQFHIDGYLTRSETAGKQPGLLVLNDGGGSVERCLQVSQHMTAMGIQVACVDIPGYGGSSGPSRFVGQPSVIAARRGLDLLAARPDVDASRLAVWGLGHGAVAAGLLMDYDSRPRALILQSGAYDMLKLWPEAPLRIKLSILREVWPSKRALRQRSVIENLPPRLDCSVLIMHGERDNRMPMNQAVSLAGALRARGAHVSTAYYPNAPHDLGRRVEPELRAFLRDNLIGVTRAAS